MYRIIYNTKGYIIEENDYDKEYAYPFSKVLALIEKRGIPAKHLSIYRNTAKNLPKWIIRWRKKENPTIGVSMMLDGKTGSILSVREYNIER